MNFPHLHLHTKFSILDGAIKPNRLADKINAMAKESNYMNEDKPQVAVTDHGNMFGAIEFYKKMKENNIKPIIGIEAYESYDDNMHKMSYKNQNEHELYHLVLLAKNNTGYKNLIKIASKSAEKGFYYNPRIDTDLIREHSEGLIILSGCLGGRIPTLILDDKIDKAKDWIRTWKDIVGNNNFFLEIQWHDQDEDKKVTENLIKLSNETDTSLVTTGDAHFIDSKQTDIMDYLIAIQKNQDLDEDDDSVIYNDLWVKKPEEIINSFPDEFQEYAKRGVRNASKIGSSCNVEIDLETVHMPEYPILKDDKTANSSKEKIWNLLIDGLINEYGDNIPAHAMQRLHNEMAVIENKGYIDYFLVVWDFIEWCKSGTVDDRDDIRYGVGLTTDGDKIEELDGGSIRPGPGRGSAAGSFVSYLIGIINKVHPIKNDLLFERFLNPERSELPDIDIDFPKTKLKKLRKYAELKYGEDYVAPLGTFNFLGARSAIREVGRIRNESTDDIEKLSEKIPEKAKHKFSVKEAIGKEGRGPKNKKLKNLYEKNSNFREWLDISCEVEGMVRSKGVHAGGILISPKKINEYIPLWKDGTTQYDMYSAKDVGAVKFDFLGLKTLDIISKSLNKIEKFKSKSLSFEDIPSYDEDAYKLIGKGKTKGLFQINKDDCGELAKRINPNNFDELAAILALYRPGPLEAGYDDRFVERKHGREEVEYPHEDVKNILEPTYGLMIYQEQVMKICQRLAGYSLAEADKMRKAIGRKIESLMEEQKEKFIKGCLSNGYSKELASSIWSDIEGFADYAFNMAHSSSYGRIAAETAYLKAHHRECFIASALSVEEEREERAKIIREYEQENNTKVELPDINESTVDFKPLKNGKISHGLDSVKSVKTKAAKEIQKEREENGRYEDINDFCLRVDRIVDKATIRALGEVGAFQSIDLTRSDVKNNLDEINNKVKSESIEATNQKSLFDDEQAPVTVNIEKAKEWSNEKKIKKEVERLGFAQYDKLIAGDLKNKIRSISEIEIEDVQQFSSGSKIVLVAFIEELWEHIDKNNNTMAFANIADATGTSRITIFSRKYEEIEKEIDERTFGIFLCKVDEFRGNKTLNLKKYSELNSIKDKNKVHESINSPYWQTKKPRKDVINAS